MEQVQMPANDQDRAATQRTAEGSQPTKEAVPDAPRFFARSRLDYDHGVPHGAWVDAAQDDEAIAGDIQAMLTRSPTATRNGIRARDWSFTDVSGFGGFQVDGLLSLYHVGAVGRGIARHGQAFGAYATLVDNVRQLDGFQDHYLGDWDSLDAYAASFVDDAGYNRLLDENLPDSIRGYVRLDTAAVARDMTASGAVQLAPLPDGRVAIFAHD